MTGFPWSPELTLLRAVCARDTRTFAVSNAVENVTDWDEALRLARVHGLASIAHDRLASIVHPQIPDDFRAALLAEKRRNAANLALRERVLAEIRNLAKPSKIRELKGGQIADWAYDVPKIRHVGDLDLLVRDQDIPDVDLVIRSMGYRQKAPRFRLDGRT